MERNKVIQIIYGRNKVIQYHLWKEIKIEVVTRIELPEQESAKSEQYPGISREKQGLVRWNEKSIL